MEFIREFPWTAILSVLVTIISIIFKRVFDHNVKPFLERKGLSEAAAVAVNAAEAVFGRFRGEDKMKYALESLKLDGWNIESTVVIDAIKAAWQSLDLTQIAVGIKDKEEEPARAMETPVEEPAPMIEPACFPEPPVDDVAPMIDPACDPEEPVEDVAPMPDPASGYFVEE